jgi:Flp pilus assembly protein TadG
VSDRGAAAVETAIVLPLLLMVIFGLIDFGRMVNAQITVTEAAREATRAEALGADPAQRAAAITDSLGAVRVTPLDSCADPGNTSGNARVQVEYDFAFVTPVGSLAEMFGGSGPSGTVTLTSRSVMPCQQ